MDGSDAHGTCWALPRQSLEGTGNGGYPPPLIASTKAERLVSILELENFSILFCCFLLHLRNFWQQKLKPHLWSILKFLVGIFSFCWRFSCCCLEVSSINSRPLERKEVDAYKNGTWEFFWTTEMHETRNQTVLWKSMEVSENHGEEIWILQIFWRWQASPVQGGEGPLKLHPQSKRLSKY